MNTSRMSSRALALGLMFGLTMIVTSRSYADSSCWPEELLVGKASMGYIEGINYEFPNAAGSCTVELFDAADVNPGSAQPCDELQCIKGECGGGGEHTMLPIEDRTGAFVQARTKQGKAAWLRLDGLGRHGEPEIRPVIAVGKTGEMFPASAPLLDAVNGIPIESRPGTAYTVVELMKADEEEWVKVEMNEILRDEPPVALGKFLGMAYFKFRNSDGVIEAVLSDIWCD